MKRIDLREQGAPTIKRVKPIIDDCHELSYCSDRVTVNDKDAARVLLREMSESALIVRSAIDDFLFDLPLEQVDTRNLLLPVREFVDYVSILASANEHVTLDADGVLGSAAPYEPNAAECLEEIERECVDSIPDTELCDMVLCAVRDARKALGLPNDSGAGMVADKLETLKEQGQDAEQAPESALHWRVDATDEQGKPITVAAFYTESEAEEYAHWLQSADWKATVKEIV